MRIMSGVDMTMEFIIAGLLVFSHFLNNNTDLPFPESFNESQIKIAVNRSCNRMIDNEKLKVLEPRKLLKSFAAGDREVFSQSDLSPTIKKIFKDFDFKTFFKFLSTHCYAKDLAMKSPSLFDTDKVNSEYQKILSEVKDTSEFKEGALPGMKPVYDRNGIHITDFYNANERRLWVNLSEVPKTVINAIISAEDARFYKHRGVDENGLLRAFVKSFSGGRLEGGSTITQQVAKNLFVGANQTLRRKFVEMATAYELERNYGKDRILELYVNLVYMGRTTWGLKLAAQTYFDKELKELTLSEAATLAGLIRWPGTNNPIANPRVALTRRNQVLEAMFQEGYINKTQLDQAIKSKIVTSPKSGEKTDEAYQFYLAAAREELQSPIQKLQYQMYKTIKLNMDSKLQQLVVQALQQGLEDYETQWKKNVYRGALSNIIEEQKSIEQKELTQEIPQTKKLSIVKNHQPQKQESSEVDKNQKKQTETLPKNWQELLNKQKITPPVNSWELAVVLNGENSIGLKDGSQVQMKSQFLNVPKLKLGDVIFVKKISEKEFSLVQTPEVQGAMVVIDVHTGEVLALTGGYAWSADNKFNRATQALRQPGSLVKPFTYMAALQSGIQPHDIFSDSKVYFYDKRKVWSPDNFDGRDVGEVTLRYGLEHSRNTVTARVMDEIGLDSILNVLKDFGLYQKPIKEKSIILGTQETTLLNITRVFSQIANGGKRLLPRFSYSTGAFADLNQVSGSENIEAVDATTLSQIRSLMQGVIKRGTGVALRKHGEYLAGKTGTSNGNKDAWFLGYTPDLAMGVYVGYDKPKTLNNTKLRMKQATGGNVALPIFEKVFSQLIKDRDVQTYSFREPVGANVEYVEIPVIQSFEFLKAKEPTIVETFRRGYYKPSQTHFSPQIIDKTFERNIEPEQENEQIIENRPTRSEEMTSSKDDSSKGEPTNRPRRRGEIDVPDHNDPIWEWYKNYQKN